jgi:hypothetical protein
VLNFSCIPGLKNESYVNIRTRNSYSVVIDKKIEDQKTVLMIDYFVLFIIPSFLIEIT